MQDDKRKLRRRHIRSYMGVYDAADYVKLGQLVDITEHGVLVITEEPVKEGRERELSIRLTSKLDGEDEIRFQARCVWCEEDINPDYYAVGLEITEIDTRAAGLITMLINKYGLRVLDEPTGEDPADGS